MLSDWAEIDYVDLIHSKHPAPKNPETGVQCWDKGIRLHGNQRALMKSRAKFKQARGGWRAGKSWLGADEIYVDYRWRTSIRERYDDAWCVIAPDFRQAVPEMVHLDRLLSEAKIPHTYLHPDKERHRILFPHNDCQVVTMSASDIQKIANVAFRGMVFAEAAQSVEEAFTNCRGRVSETNGWVTLEGTFEDASQWWYRLAEEWTHPGAMGETFALPSWENLVVYPEGRYDPKIVAIEAREAPDTFFEKYGGEPVKRTGLVFRYADERYCVAERFPFLGHSFDQYSPVYLAIDPGATHGYAVLACQFEVQPVTGQVTCWVIDTILRWNREAHELIDECAHRYWAKNVEAAVMDFAGRQARSEGPSNFEQWQAGWLDRTRQQLYIIAEPVPLTPGYDVHKRALLNTWPENEAQRMFNHDGRRGRVTDPDGVKLMFSPASREPLFGGVVDGTHYPGEYNLHRNKRKVLGFDPVDEHNDLIKAINYLLYWRVGPTGNDRRGAHSLDSFDWEFVA